MQHLAACLKATVNLFVAVCIIIFHLFLQGRVLLIWISVNRLSFLAKFSHCLITIWKRLLPAFIGCMIGAPSKPCLRLGCSEKFFPYKVGIEVTEFTFQVPLVYSAKLSLKRRVARYQVVYDALLCRHT